MRFSIKKTKVFLTLTIMLIAVVFAQSINAQSGTTGISGTVTDQTGAAVPGATVRLVNTAIGFERTVTTNDEGKYNFPTIQPATYRVEVEASNFKKSIRSDVQALVDSPIIIDIRLEPGDVTAVVNVITLYLSR
jgi:hypothetical protein